MDTASYKPNSETAKFAELGRSKYASTKPEHLFWLLDIGWDKDSPLIRKYVRKNQLDKELAEYVGQ